MKKILNKNLLAWLIVSFILIQTGCELYFFYGNNMPLFFGFAIPTVVRLLFVFIIGIVYLFTTKFSKKHIVFLSYLVLVLAYFLLHHFHTVNFTSLVPGDFGYSFITEAFYIIRVIIPYFLFMVCLDIKFSKKQIKTIVYGLLIILTGSLLVSNIFVIGTGSYSKERILGNIFTWFTNGYEKYSYYGLATKGFFHDPNRLSALMILLSGIVLAMCYLKKSKLSLVIVFLQMIACCMIGTKVATYGFLVLLILFLLVYLFNIFILKKEKINWLVCSVLVLFIILDFIIIPFSPCKDRTASDDDQIKNSKKADNVEELNEAIDDITLLVKQKDDDALIDYLVDNQKDFRMNEGFVMYFYPIKYDPYFWADIYRSSLEQRYNYRFIEESMLNRIKEINNNKYDNLLGISYTRESNVFELERDFKAQYYSMGILGVIILFVPYFLIIGYLILKILFRLKERYDVALVILIATLCLYLGAAYFSGNVLDAFVTSINFGILLGIVYNKVIGGSYEN